MKFGFSGEAFGNLLILSAIIMVIVMSTACFIAHKRGVDVTTHRFGLTLLIGCAIIFIVIPFWLTDLTIKDKILGTILMFAFGFGNYFAIDRKQRRVWKEMADKKKKEEQENNRGKQERSSGG
jgi:hypothetical protein